MRQNTLRNPAIGFGLSQNDAALVEIREHT